MRFIILSVLLLSILVNLINAHAVLVKPIPFSTNPSKTQQCGGGTKQGTAQAVLCPGKSTRMEWSVVVGDGTGPVTFKLSPTGGVTAADFTTTLTSVDVGGAAPNAVGKFFMDVTIPATTCTDGKCVIQAFSSSGWYSCAVVNIDAATCDTAPDETAPVPVKITANSGITFCDSVVNKVVLLPAGTNVAAYDAATRGVFTANMKNPLVIGTNTTDCAQLYQPILCDTSFPLNPGSDKLSVYQVTKQQCENFVDVCDVVTHKDLYPCDIYPGNSSSFVVVPVLLILSILSMTLLF